MWHDSRVHLQNWLLVFIVKDLGRFQLCTWRPILHTFSAVEYTSVFACFTAALFRSGRWLVSKHRPHSMLCKDLRWITGSLTQTGCCWRVEDGLNTTSIRIVDKEGVDCFRKTPYILKGITIDCECPFFVCTLHRYVRSLAYRPVQETGRIVVGFKCST